jgi:serine protease Do
MTLINQYAATREVGAHDTRSWRPSSSRVGAEVMRALSGHSWSTRAGVQRAGARATRCAAGVARTLSLAASLIGLLAYCADSAAQSGYAGLVRRVAPSVVTVLVAEQSEDAGHRAAARAIADANDDGMRDIMRRLISGPGSSPEAADGGSVLGSGFIVRSDGIIVTNRHVIVGARSVRVRLADAREVPAQVIGADAATDLALLKVDAGPLPALRLGSSAKVSVGDAVIAIGNPFGLGETVTAGIISARGRTLEADPYIDFLQTDAAINHGNSGGPLLSADGDVVGVTSAIFSPTGTSIGLGFAIPSDTVAAVAAELEAHGRVDRGYLGITAQPMTPGLATALGLPKPDGALIAALEPHGPSFGTLAVGDVLLRVGSTPVTFAGLGKVTARLRPDSLVDVTVIRGGVARALSVRVGQLPDPPSDPVLTGAKDTWARSLALGLANTTPEIRKALKAEDEEGGLIVTQLRRAGPGALAGLKIGDLITHAGTTRLTDVGALATVSKPTPQQPLLLRVIRDGSARFIAVTGSDEQ